MDILKKLLSSKFFGIVPLEYSRDRETSDAKNLVGQGGGKNYKQKTAGFTLIELLVVISIIGLLSSVVLASLKTARDKAKASAVVSTMLQIKNAAELYKTSTGSYPDSGPLDENPQLFPNYLPAVPENPFDISAHFYIGFEEVSYKSCGGKIYNISEAEGGKLYIYTTLSQRPTGLFSKYRQNSSGGLYDGSNNLDTVPCVE